MKPSEHLIDYIVVDVDQAPMTVVKELVQQAQNRPYELRGETKLDFLLAVFLRLRSIASEITFRPSGQKTSKQHAYIITTHLNTEDILRPFDVLPVDTFSEAELMHFEQAQAADTTTDMHINLSAWSKGSAHDFLQQLYATSQTKSLVELQGQASPLLVLLVVNWFYSPTTRFVLNGSPIR